MHRFGSRINHSFITYMASGLVVLDIYCSKHSDIYSSTHFIRRMLSLKWGRQIKSNQNKTKHAKPTSRQIISDSIETIPSQPQWKFPFLTKYSRMKDKVQQAVCISTSILPAALEKMVRRGIGLLASTSSIDKQTNKQE